VPSTTVGSLWWPTSAPDRRARVAPLPCEQGRVDGVGDVGDGVGVTDRRDRGEAGPGGSCRGVRKKRESATGRRWGADMRAWAA
jgi:hypothetical protein